MTIQQIDGEAVPVRSGLKSFDVSKKTRPRQGSSTTELRYMTDVDIGLSGTNHEELINFPHAQSFPGLKMP